MPVSIYTVRRRAKTWIRSCGLQRSTIASSRSSEKKASGDRLRRTLQVKSRVRRVEEPEPAFEQFAVREARMPRRRITSKLLSPYGPCASMYATTRLRVERWRITTFSTSAARNSVGELSQYHVRYSHISVASPRTCAQSARRYRNRHMPTYPPAPIAVVDDPSSGSSTSTSKNWSLTYSTYSNAISQASGAACCIRRVIYVPHMHMRSGHANSSSSTE